MKHTGKVTNNTDVVTNQKSMANARSVANALVSNLRAYSFKLEENFVFTDVNTPITLNIETDIYPDYLVFNFQKNFGSYTSYNNQITFNSYFDFTNNTSWPLYIYVYAYSAANGFDYNTDTYVSIGTIYINKTAENEYKTSINRNDILLYSFPQQGFEGSKISSQKYVEESINKLTVDTASITSLINVIHPVGSVYITFSDTFDPNTAWPNTTWTKIKEGIFLEATENTAGTEKEAGLPNITGNAYNIQGVDYSADGAFTKTALGYSGWSGNIAGLHHLKFDASKSNAIYGKSETVQPHSLTVVMWQRTG